MLRRLRAIGIAGGHDKCAYVRSELGFDAVVDHRSTTFPTDLASACPNGIDVYFENVGGAVWDAVLPNLNKYARVPLCGLVALYNGTGGKQQNNLPETMTTLLKQSILVRGFINTEFVADLYQAFGRDIGPLVASGHIKYREDVIEGLDNAPEAFIGMLEGKNFGKLLVRVADR
jgi:NADPH-dependent curcumin reductase CurA